MAGPWEKYSGRTISQDKPSGPWNRYKKSDQTNEPISDYMMDVAEKTPIGMAARGGYETAKLAGKVFTPFISVSPKTQERAKSILRPFQAAGVGQAEFMGNPLSPERGIRAGKGFLEAMKPDYKPKTMLQKIGSTAGEMVPVVGASVLSPSVGGPLAIATQQAANEGRVSPVPFVPTALRILNRGVRATGLPEKIVPPLLKSAKGTPTEVSKMVMKDKSILELEGTSKSIQQKSQRITDSINEASRRVGERFGKTYEEQGVPNLVDEVIAGNKSRFNGRSFDQLRQSYQDALKGDLFKKKGIVGEVENLSNQEKLGILTDLKRSLQNEAVYPVPGQQISPADGARNTAIKKMARDIDQLRGTLPGGDKLSAVDDAWTEMKEIKQRLMSAFSDPYKGQDYLNRILKGNTDWLTQGRNAGRIGAIERVEEITGQKVLQPALKEMAAAYVKNPDVLSLPSFGLTSILSVFIPTKSILKGPADLLKGISEFTSSTGAIFGDMKPLSEKEAFDYLRRAKGDPNLARRMALEDGRVIPE